MLGLPTELGFAGWMVAGAMLALAAVTLRQKIQDRRQERLRGDWDSY